MAKRLTVQNIIDGICAILEEYLADQQHYPNAIMTIGHVKGELAIEIYKASKINRPADGQEYALTDIYVVDELGVGRPNYEAIEKIANFWVTRQ